MTRCDGRDRTATWGTNGGNASKQRESVKRLSVLPHARFPRLTGRSLALTAQMALALKPIATVLSTMVQQRFASVRPGRADDREVGNQDDHFRPIPPFATNLWHRLTSGSLAELRRQCEELDLRRPGANLCAFVRGNLAAIYRYYLPAAARKKYGRNSVRYAFLPAKVFRKPCCLPALSCSRQADQKRSRTRSRRRLRAGISRRCQTRFVEVYGRCAATRWMFRPGAASNHPLTLRPGALQLRNISASC